LGTGTGNLMRASASIKTPVENWGLGIGELDWGSGMDGHGHRSLMDSSIDWSRQQSCHHRN